MDVLDSPAPHQWPERPLLWSKQETGEQATGRAGATLPHTGQSCARRLRRQVQWINSNISVIHSCVCFRVCKCAPYLHRRCAAAAWERWGWDETWTDPQRHRDKPRTQTGQNHLPEPAPCERKRKTLFINTATGVRGQGFFTLTLVVLTEPISTSCTAALVSKVICQSLTSVLPPRGQVHV